MLVGKTACVVMYVLSLVTQGMGFRRVHTQLAKKAAVVGWTVVRQDGRRWGQTGVGQMETSW